MSKEHTRKNVVTIIEEYSLRDGNVITSTESVTRSLLFNGEQLYCEKTRHPEAGLLYEITNKLCYLTGDKKPKSSCNTTSDAGDLLNLVGHGGFKAFNFKQKFLYILLKKLFLSGKAAPSNKVVSIYFYGNQYTTSETSFGIQKVPSFKMPNDSI